MVTLPAATPALGFEWAGTDIMKRCWRCTHYAESEVGGIYEPTPCGPLNDAGLCPDCTRALCDGNAR